MTDDLDEQMGPELRAWMEDWWALCAERDASGWTAEFERFQARQLELWAYHRKGRVPGRWCPIRREYYQPTQEELEW